MLSTVRGICIVGTQTFGALTLFYYRLAQVSASESAILKSDPFYSLLPILLRFWKFPAFSTDFHERCLRGVWVGGQGVVKPALPRDIYVTQNIPQVLMAFSLAVENLLSFP